MYIRLVCILKQALLNLFMLQIAVLLHAEKTHVHQVNLYF
jgi:hypothetical protein